MALFRFWKISIRDGHFQARIWVSAKVSHKRVFALLTPEIHSYEMAQTLQKPVFALPGCQQMSVNTLLCDTLALADIFSENEVFKQEWTFHAQFGPLGLLVNFIWDLEHLMQKIGGKFVGRLFARHEKEVGILWQVARQILERLSETLCNFQKLHTTEG